MQVGFKMYFRCECEHICVLSVSVLALTVTDSLAMVYPTFHLLTYEDRDQLYTTLHSEMHFPECKEAHPN